MIAEPNYAVMNLSKRPFCAAMAGLLHRFAHWCCLIIGMVCLSGAIAATAMPASAVAPQEQPRWSQLSDSLFQHLTTEHGLPSALITTLAQDGDGFLWVGTQGGLVRWDGYRFKNYKNDTKDAGSLPGSYVNTLYADRGGQLWVGTTDGGLARYDNLHDRFVRIPVGKDGISHEIAWATVDDDNAGLWVGTNKGLDYLSNIGSDKGLTASHFVHDPKNPASLPAGRVQTLLLDRDKQLWVGTSKGLALRSGQNRDFIHVPLPIAAGATAAIKSMEQSTDGRIWVAVSGQGVFVLDPKTRLAQAFHETAYNPGERALEAVNFIRQVTQEQLWIGTDGKGILVVETAAVATAAVATATVRTRWIRNHLAAPASLGFDSVVALARDRSGLIWIGSQHGLGRHDPNQRAFSSVFGGSTSAEGIADKNITGVTLMPNGYIWLGLRNQGVNIINPQASKIIRPAPEAGLAINNVRSLTTPWRDKIYWGTANGVFSSDLAGQQKQRLFFPPRDPASFSAVIFREDNQLLMAGIDGLWQADLDQPAPAQAKRVPGTEQLNHTQIILLMRAPDGALWISTVGSGLYRLDPVSHQLRAIPTDSTDPEGLSRNAVRSLLFDRRGRLWIATQGGGINLLADPNAKGKLRFQKFTQAQGLPNNAVNKLLQDGQGHIWASTDDGLARIDVNTLALQAMQQAEGVATGPHWVSSGANTNHGELLFGGTRGLTVVRPDLFKVWDYHPPVVVTRIQSGGKEVAANRFNQASSTEAAMPEPVLITPDANSLTVEFSALDFSAPERNRYLYWLEGFDPYWIATDPSRRLAAYTNLPAGEYRLRMRGSNRNGVFSEPERVVPIHVLPAWHQTWWFTLAKWLAASAAVYALVQGRTRYLQYRRIELQEQVRQGTAELRDKQAQLVETNQELYYAYVATNEANDALNNANGDLLQSLEILRQLGDIGREITANLETEAVFQSLYLYVAGLLDAPVMMIYRLNAAATELEAVFGRDGAQVLSAPTVALLASHSSVAWVARERKELLLDIGSDNWVSASRPMQSALLEPMIVNDRVLGVMSIQSEKAHAYGEREGLIFRTLSAYGAIAMANASAMAALHQAQGQLVQQEKMASLGSLVAGIAHQINTPLGTALVALSGASTAWKVLQKAAVDGRVGKSLLVTSTTDGIAYTNLAISTTTRAAELIAVFKTIAVSTSHDRLVELDLAHYLPELASLVRLPLEGSGNLLEIDVAQGLTVQTVEEALTETLARVLMNVIDHAFVDARTGTLHLGAQFDDSGDVLISVSDNGHGITAEDLPLVFDPFFSTKSGSQMHVGLGLHVAYNQVTQRLKGEIGIVSTLNEGTCVTIRLKKHHPGQGKPDQAESS